VTLITLGLCSQHGSDELACVQWRGRLHVCDNEKPNQKSVLIKES